MFTVGSATIHKIHEMNLSGFTLRELLPTLDEELLERYPSSLAHGKTGSSDALLSIHTWLLRHQGMTILIDTGAGNGKSRPQQMPLDHLSNPFLERLAAAGVGPEMVDYVLHTHIHSDHVGWNTRLVNGKWEPTFPNAITICSSLEWAYGKALADGEEQDIASARTRAGFGEPIRIPVSGTFNDSMRPLQPTGRLRLVEVNDNEVLPGIRFISTPGHSIDHAAIELVSNGSQAIFGGDVLHHPVEIYDPALLSSFCEFPKAARHSRRFLLERSAKEGCLYLSSHFTSSSAGRITRDKNGYQWEFADPEPE